MYVCLYMCVSMYVCCMYACLRYNNHKLSSSPQSYCDQSAVYCTIIHCLDATCHISL